MRHSVRANRRSLAIFVAALLLPLPCIPAAPAASVDEAKLRSLLYPQPNIQGIRELGAGPVMPLMVRMYERSGEDERRSLAYVFYELRWKSAEAKRALMKDAYSPNRWLKVSVNYALVQVSTEPDVIDLLFRNMMNDPDMLVSEKSACALAHQTVPLSDEQRIHFYGRLIGALRDSRKHIRDWAARVLFDQTGQSKRFRAGAPEAEREAGVREWEAWLREYRANL
jgi:hypothetical protein